MAVEKISTYQLASNQINLTFGENFPLACLCAAVGRNSFVQILKQILHLATALPFCEFVADPQFRCATVVTDPRRHAFSLKILNRAMGHAMMMRVFYKRQLGRTRNTFSQSIRLTIVKSSLPRR
jgi:hypothetical protein